MDFDLILREARIAGRAERTADIGISKGRIAAIAPDLPQGVPERKLNGRLAVPGFIETHIHLDKSCILGRCQCEKGTLDEASVRVENGELHASFAGAAGSAPHDLVVVPSATCMPPPSAPCDPRSRARTGDAAAPTATTVAATGVAATRDTDDASDTEGFRCAASTDGLSVVDAHGRPIWTRSGRFQRCALETLAERFVVVASSWSESSLHGGPLDVSVYVVARDSLELVARHEGVVRNLDAYLVRDGEGLWIGWMHLHDFEVVRLDALGARVGPVRTLGALYYEPRIEMRTGSDGPTLHWETEDAEGEIPFCSLGRVGE